MDLNTALATIRNLIQVDPGRRGLAADPRENLFTSTRGDFAAACRAFATVQRGHIGIVTGFAITSVEPARAETDGPPGALFLARVLHALGLRVTLITDQYAAPALDAALRQLGLGGVAVRTVPLEPDAEAWAGCVEALGPVTHLISIERAGPAHTPQSIAAQQEGTRRTVEQFRGEVSEVDFDRCHNMRGRDITPWTAPLHRLFDEGVAPFTIGIGDGGNEIGMGKVAWQTIQRNIPGGGVVACRVATDQLIVCGVSNWGGYALAHGVSLVRGRSAAVDCFDPALEQQLLQTMLAAGPLVDGVTGQETCTVDGLPWEQYLEPIVQLLQIRVD